MKWIMCFEYVEGGEVVGFEVFKLDEYNIYYIFEKRKGGDCLNLIEC